MPDPIAIHHRLFATEGDAVPPLLAAFLADDSEARLAEMAAWYGLEVVLRTWKIEPDVSAAPNPAALRWLALLSRIADDEAFPSPPAGATGPEPPPTFGIDPLSRFLLLGVVDALAALGDDGAPPADSPMALWRQILEGYWRKSGLTMLPQRLQGRRWSRLTRRLAQVLAAASLTTSPHLLPRYPRSGQTFTEDDLNHVAVRLRESPGSTLVIDGPPGSGTSELALAFCTRAVEQRAVERVYWVRSGDQALMETDLDAMADRVLDDLAHRDATDPAGPTTEGSPEWLARRRRHAIAVLEATAGWALVFDGCTDPALLVPWVPSSASGQVLITTSTGTEASHRVEGWRDYLHLDVGTMEDAEHRPRGLTGDNVMAVPPLDADRLLALLGEPHEGDVVQLEDRPRPSWSVEDLDTLVGWTGGSRRAAALAARWLDRPDRDVAMFIEAVGDGEPATAAAGLLLADLVERDLPREEREDAAKALRLLCRVNFFARAPIPCDALTDPETPALAINDMRLTLLDDLGLVNVLDGWSHSPCFEIATEVHDAVARTDTFATERADHLDHAAHTALMLSRWLPHGEAGTDVLTADPRHIPLIALPHIVAVAGHLDGTSGGSVPRPVTAIELLARAAARNWSAARRNEASRLVKKMEGVFTTSSAEVQDVIRAGGREVWSIPELGSELSLPPTVGRLHRLVAVLRKAGYLRGARVLGRLAVRACDQTFADTGDAPPDGGERLDPGIQQAYARLCFELAACLRDDPTAALPGERSAGQLLDLAADTWRMAGNTRWAMSADLITHVIALDRGDVLEAEGHLRTLLKGAEGLLADADDPADVRELMARIQFVHGRALTYLGRLPEALATFRACEESWTVATADADTPQRAGARANAAHIEALLGHAVSLEQAREAWDEMVAARGVEHPDAAQVRAILAEVCGLMGRDREAVDHAGAAVRSSRRYWPDDHPMFLRTWRLAADADRSVGRLEIAAHNLLRGFPSGPGRGPDRAQVWMSIGDVLLDEVPFLTNGTRTEADLKADGQVLNDAADCFRMARRLLAPDGDPSDPTSPWAFHSLRCDLRLLEVELRQGMATPRHADRRAATADALVGRALALTRGEWWPLAIVARAQELRARAATIDPKDAGQAHLVQKLKADLTQLRAGCSWPQGPHATADRIQVALATCIVDYAVVKAAELSHPPSEREALTKEIEKEVTASMHDAWENLDIPAGQPHPLRAIGYAGLAYFQAYREKQRHRGRNERERDEHRARLTRHTLHRITEELQHQRATPDGSA